jgi:hypothetical protein
MFEEKRGKPMSRVFIYNGTKFPALRGKMQFGTFVGERVYVTLMAPLDVTGVNDLIGFILMMLRNDYCRITVDVGEAYVMPQLLMAVRSTGAEVVKCFDRAAKGAVA